MVSELSAMPNDTAVENLLDNIQKALNSVEEIQNVESIIDKLDTVQNRKLLKKIKHVVNVCYSKVGNIRDKVNKAYKKVKIRDCENNDLDDSVAENVVHESSVDDNEETFSDSTSKDKCIEETAGEEGTKNVETTVHSSNIECNIAENVNNCNSDESIIIPADSVNLDNTEKAKESSTIDSEIKDCMNEENLVSEENQQDLQEHNNIDVDKESEGSVEKNKEKESEYEEGIRTEDKEKEIIESDLNNKDEHLVTNIDKNVDTDAKRPVIKLVDINKLMAPNKTLLDVVSPKPKKSVKFDSSVIILSSSDEDTSNNKPKGKHQNPLKSAMRKSSSNMDASSDSDSKENKEETKRKVKGSKDKLRTSKATREQNSSSDEPSSRSKTSNNKKRRIKNGKKVTSDEDGRKKVLDSDSDSDQSTKTLRLRNTKSDEDSRKKVLDSDSDSDQSTKTLRVRNTKSRNRKRYREDSSSSEHSNDSDVETLGTNKTSKKIQSVNLNEDNSKLKSAVIIRLPRYTCEELIDIYRKKKDATAKKKSDKTLHSDNKRIKLTLKVPKRNQKLVSDSDSTDDNSKSNENDNQDDVGKKNSEDIVEIQRNDEVNDKNDDETLNDSKEKQNKSSELNGKDILIESTSEDTNINDHEDNEKQEANKLSSKESSSDEDFATFSKRKDKSNAELVSDDDVLPVKRKAKKRMKKNAVLTDSDSENEAKEDTKVSSDESSSSDSEKEQDKESKEKKSSRSRIKRTKDSSSSDEEDKSTRKHLRKMIDRDSLSETTKKAEAAEKARKARILEKQKKYNQIFELKADAKIDKVVLDFDEKDESPLLSVHKHLVKHLKPHQVQGVKFMFDACFESLERAQNKAGSGCILAHCMGLGKTLQVITLAHTLLSKSDKTKVEKIMVVCPVNTVLNWKSEFAKWLPRNNEIEVYELVSCKTSSVNHERAYKVRDWHENGGVLIIGYNMFRTLTNPDNKTITRKLRTTFQEGLVDPGPDLVVCDEGHLLKNEKTSLSISMNRIKTARRIVLTGTPLQNNLREYWCMVQFIKPNLLGTYKEYLNRFVNPVTNGQYTDSTPHDITIMRRRSHVLHKLLDGVVQRQDYDVLAPYLPPKYEFVLFIQLTEVQVKLYKHYVANISKKGDSAVRTSFLFTDFQELQRICTHPIVLMEKSNEDKEKLINDSDSEGSLRDFIDDGSEGEGESTPNSDSSESNSASDASVRSQSKKKKKGKGKTKKRVTRAQAAQKRDAGESSESEPELVERKEWWEEYIDKEQLDNLNHSGKMFLLFEILKECEEIGDKILVFSQSLYTLNCIEHFLRTIDEATQTGDTEKIGGHSGSWAIGLDYFRLDGSSSCDNRATWCDAFNNPNNTRARLFLISTKAGGLGINLVAANRVIIFDVSWNPSHDIQSIYRVYRFGQTKPCYIYRFVNYGTMEMKIYERQVTKQAISKRVIDEQQIDRHYSQNDIQELYKMDLEPTDRPIPMVPRDVLLGEMLQKYEKTIYKYHEHQSLLENKQDEELNEEERKAAWDEFENEKKFRTTVATNFGMTAEYNAIAFQNRTGLSIPLVHHALGSIVRKDNPAWSEVQIKGIIPALVQQLQLQISENNFTLMNRVQQEIRMMQAIQAQRIREQYIHELRLRQMLQKQQLTNQMLGSMSISPEEVMQLAAVQENRNPAGPSGNVVIDLND